MKTVYKKIAKRIEEVHQKDIKRIELLKEINMIEIGIKQCFKLDLLTQEELAELRDKCHSKRFLIPRRNPYDSNNN